MGGFNEVEPFRDNKQREKYAQKCQYEVREYKKTGKYIGKHREKLERKKLDERKD